MHHARRLISGARRAAQGLSAALLLFAAPAYALRPDALAAFTIFPVWVWPPLGLLLAGRPGKRRRVATLLLGLWLVVLAGFADEARALLHPGAWRSAPRPGVRAPRTLRVVSLNCAGGDPTAADEVRAWNPDIVLLQESPRPDAVRALARRLFGSDTAAVVALDTSVLAKSLIPLPLDRRTAGATVTLEGGAQVVVACVRLNPTLLRTDLWNPACWRAFADDRRARRDELAAVLAKLPKTELPRLVGGDLNAPAGDGALAPLAALELRDAYADAGAGWANTIGNETPVHRIDQIWRRGLTPRSLIVVPTAHSDHRMVVADFDL